MRLMYSVMNNAKRLSVNVGVLVPLRQLIRVMFHLIEPNPHVGQYKRNGNQQ